MYIKYNVTYSCEIQKCPPMALVTSPGGATLEVKLNECLNSIRFNQNRK